MGAAFTFVLVCSNIMISLLRKVIPGKVHLPCYIVIIAGFVTIVQMFMQATWKACTTLWACSCPDRCQLYHSGPCEMFACKNSVVDSALDGIGMGIGFTITLTIMGTIREILGSGTWMAGLDGLLPFLPEGFKIQVIPTSVDPFTLMTSAPGGFFVFGVMMAAATWLTTRPKKEKKPAETVEGGNA